jgi:hypothetical protein
MTLGCAFVGQRDQAAALSHQRQSATGDLRERVAGDGEAALEVGLGGVDVAALQLFLVGEGDGMDHEVEPAPFILQALEQRIEAPLVLDVGFLDDPEAELLDHRDDALAEGAALVREGELGARGMQRLRDAPGDRAFVGHAHHQATLAFHQVADHRQLAGLRRRPWRLPGSGVRHLSL